AHNGLCLSNTYINISTPLRWKCSRDHEWDAPLDRIKYKNTWCPVCEGRHSFHLEIAKKIAINKGGLCLSIQCTATKELLEKPCTLEDAIKVAHARNGKCLSEKFINTLKMQIHGVPIVLDDMLVILIKPSKLHLAGMLCREILTEYLGSPSLTRRPEFLKTPEHSIGLELDIFYPEYGFAIEVQGVQHEKYIEFFHNDDPNNFIKQQERDQLKKELCKENWIALRYVWYYEDPYIVIPEHLRELGLIK
ncbi:18598_t:CDS:2, partial [Racocetra fulgida]